MTATSVAQEANVVTESVDDNVGLTGIRWTLEYCSNEPTNVLGGGGA